MVPLRLSGAAAQLPAGTFQQSQLLRNSPRGWAPLPSAPSSRRLTIFKPFSFPPAAPPGHPRDYHDYRKPSPGRSLPPGPSRPRSAAGAHADPSLPAAGRPAAHTAPQVGSVRRQEPPAPSPPPAAPRPPAVPQELLGPRGGGARHPERGLQPAARRHLAPPRAVRAPPAAGRRRAAKWRPAGGGRRPVTRGPAGGCGAFRRSGRDGVKARQR